MSAKAYDLVLFGATGFTGGLVAEYLARRKVPGLRWALAGRDPEKLARARARLAAIDPALSALPIVNANSRDPLTLRALCERTRVVCTTVGPYSLHGRDLVDACVREGSDYCDLTGEVPFVRDMIDQHHAAAQESKVRIVPSCGFDSIPSDLGVYMMHQAAAARGDQLRAVRLFVGEVIGGVSGGTIASMQNMVEEASRDRARRRLLMDPYALCPGETGPDGRDQLGMGYDKDLGRFTGPFVMAAVNSRVVRRSNMLSGHAYGRDFRYSEVSSFPAGPAGFVKGALMTAGLGAAVAVLTSPLRRMVGGLLPQPGDGPSEEVRRNGSFRMRLIADLVSGARLYGVVEGRSDPGYGETAKMLSESALCLLQDPPQTGFEGGVLTPAMAMGEALLTRLRQAEMTFAVVPELP